MPFTHPIPSVVSDCSRSVLEWDRFLDLLAGYAQSATGKQWLHERSLRRPTLTGFAGEHTLVAEMRLLMHGRRAAFAGVALRSL